jgi:hypothetical protein
MGPHWFQKEGPENFRISVKRIFFEQKLQYIYPEASMKDVQTTKEPSSLPRDHSALENITFLQDFLFLWVFLPTWIQIRIPNADPDATSHNQCGSHAEPDLRTVLSTTFF